MISSRRICVASGFAAWVSSMNAPLLKMVSGTMVVAGFLFMRVVSPFRQSIALSRRRVHAVLWASLHHARHTARLLFLLAAAVSEPGVPGRRPGKSDSARE